MEESTQKWIRWICVTDPKGRKVGYQLIESTRNPNDVIKLAQECEENAKLYEAELKEEEEKKALLAKYSVKKLIASLNFCLLTGKIPSDKRSDLLTAANGAITMDAGEERSNTIKAIIESSDELAEVFNAMED